MRIRQSTNLAYYKAWNVRKHLFGGCKNHNMFSMNYAPRQEMEGRFGVKTNKAKQNWTILKETQAVCAYTRVSSLVVCDSLLGKTKEKEAKTTPHRQCFKETCEWAEHFLMLVLREIYDYDKFLIPFFLTHTTKLRFLLGCLFRARKKESRNMYNHLLIVIIIRSVNGFGNEY